MTTSAEWEQKPQRRSRRAALVMVAVLAVFGGGTLSAQVESDPPSGDLEAVGSTPRKGLMCDGVGCTDNFTALVRWLRTVIDGEESIFVWPQVATALRDSGACPAGWTSDQIIINGLGADAIVNKLHIALAMEYRLKLRVSHDGPTGCKLNYVLLYTI